MVAAVALGRKTQGFPKAAVVAALRQELLAGLRQEAKRNHRAIPQSDSDLAKHPVEIDSLFVVEILCVVDEVLGFEVGESVVRSGGYPSVDAALAHLAVTIEAAWKKNGGAL